MTPQQRNVVVAATLVLAALVVFAVVSSRSLAPGTITASPSPSPTATASSSATATAAAASASPAPSPSASAAPSAAPAAGSYGYLAVGGGGFALVDEAGATIQQYGCGAPGRGCNETMLAVSPDGRHVAFWLSGQTPRWEIRVFDVAVPTSVRNVVTLPDGFEGLGMAWATDSRGLLYAAQTIGYGGIQGGAGRATLSAIDTTTPAPAIDAMPARTDGAFYRPLAWDRSRNIVAAVTSGEGGFVLEYAVKVGDRYAAARANPGQFVAGQVEASSDATRILAIDMPANVIRIWPVDDFSKASKANPGVDVPRISAARWRTANEVAWSYGEKLDVFIPQSDATRTVYTASGGVRLVALRPDGTGALVAAGGAMSAVDMQTGAASRTGMAVGQVVVARGILLR